MGKKMSPETVEKFARISHDNDDSIFISGNECGYKVNITHPLIRPLYERFKEKIGCPIVYPLSDRERFQFENLIIQKFGKKYYLECIED